MPTPQTSQAPQSIRLAKILLYVRLLTAILFLVMQIGILFNPPEEALQSADQSEVQTSVDQSKEVQPSAEQLTTGKIVTGFLIILLPIAAAIVTLRAINRKKRTLAIIMSLLLFLVSSIFSPLSAMGMMNIDMIVSAIIAVMLFSRTAKAYFEGVFMPVPVGRGAPSKRVEVQDVEGDTNGGDLGESSDTMAMTTEGADVPQPRKSRPRFEHDVEIRPATPQDAITIYSLMMEAFEEYRVAVPPSSALDETIDSVREALQGGQGAAILLEDARPTAMVRYEIEGETISFFRLSVVPSRRRRGYAKQLVKWIEHQGVSKGLNYCRCKVRQTVQNNVTMYQDMGYEIVDQQLDVRPGGTVKTLLLEKKLGV